MESRLMPIRIASRLVVPMIVGNELARPNAMLIAGQMLLHAVHVLGEVELLHSHLADVSIGGLEGDGEAIVGVTEELLRRVLTSMRRELIQELSGLSTETAVRLHDECYHLVIVRLGDVSVLGLILLLFPDGRVKRRVFHVLLVEQVVTSMYSRWSYFNCMRFLNTTIQIRRQHACQATHSGDPRSGPFDLTQSTK
jgi:hypothetical protein